ncbi:MAG: SDR family NAD(P)-dependent oxidoreductase [Elusimicrobiota bacterium]
MASTDLGRILRRSGVYARNGVGFGGALLKHSLVPLSLLRDVLPSRGLLLDAGCGEGMLAGLLADALPGLRVLGVDRDAARVALAAKSAPPNASFEAGDFLGCAHGGAAAVLFNDVLHHHPDDRQKELLLKAAAALEPGGILVVKEVDARDRADRVWTSFWDAWLYPQDVLNFRDGAAWRALLHACGFALLRVERVRHPWPASRTVFVCRRRMSVAPLRAAPGAAKVLVTGATGFIGAHLARLLLAEGLGGRPADPLLLVRDRSRLSDELSGCRVLEGDLESLPARRAELEGVEAVFHLAADKDFFGGERVYENNVRGMRALISALAGLSSLRRVLFASSFGAVDRPAADECRVPVDEDAPSHATSAYGRAKSDGERLLRESGLPFTVLRIPWCYGAGMSPLTHVRKLSAMAAAGSPAARIDWPGRLSLVETSECARAFRFLASEPKAEGGVFFISDGEPVRFGTLFRDMSTAAGGPGGSLTLPEPLARLGRPLRALLPFTLRSLFLDVFTVSDARLRALGFAAAPRGPEYLLPMLRSAALELRPGRARERALVTGAASGIGRALAVRLCASGREVVLLDRDPRVRELAERLPGARAVLADLAEPSGLAAARREAEDPDTGIVVNCAGVGLRADVGRSPEGSLERLLAVNAGALTALSEAAMRNFRAAGEGVLVNFASSAAFQPLAGMAAYSASKAYALLFSEALAEEDLPPGVRVVTVCPGGTATNFQASAGVKVVPGEKLLAPEAVADRVMRALEAGRSETLFVGGRTFAMSLLARVLPRSYSARLWKRMMDASR